MKAINVLSGFLFLLFLASAASAAVIVVNDSQILLLNASEEKAYALEYVLVSGDLKTNSLDLSGEGTVLSGRDVRVYLFGPVADVLVKDVSVNGRKTTVSFDKEGYYFIVPEGEFKFTGKLLIRTPGQIRLTVRGPLSELRFKLDNGYAVDGDRYGLVNATVLLQRAAKAATIADGSFRFTFGERDEFMYQLNFKSFGQGIGGVTVELPNGERVSQVSGAVKWEQKADRLVLDLEGNTASVTVAGVFSSKSLMVPLKEDRHTVVVESDPEKKITVSTTAQEVDVSESSIHPQYGNARAFLAGRGDVIYVTVKKLDMLPSLAAAVSYATNKIAVTEKGSVLGELTYSYANTGVDYVEVDAPGNPLYASTERAPVKLTAEGKLLLALPKTQYGTLDVVYFTTRGKVKPIDVISIPLAKTDLPIRQATTQIYLPKDVYVLETFGAAGGSELPTVETAVLYIALMAALGWMLKADRRFTGYYVIASVGLLAFSGLAFLAFLAVSLVVVAKRLLAGRHLGAFVGKIGIVVAVIAISILFLVALVVVWQLGVFNMGGASYAATREYGADYAEVAKAAPAPSFKEVQVLGDRNAGGITVPTRKGVYPVKLEIPSLGKTISVTNHLVTKENPIELKVLVVASYLRFILYAISAWACVVGYRIHKEAGTRKP
jgi:hypothetical protein